MPEQAERSKQWETRQASVRAFAARMNAAGRVNEIARQDIAPGASLEGLDFSIIPVGEMNRAFISDYEGTNKPGGIGVAGHGFLLFVRKPDGAGRVLAVVSFRFDQLQGEDLANGAVDTDTREYPRIIQSQGATYKSSNDRERDEDVKELLGRIRMGLVLLDIVTLFAKENRYPAVAILPARVNASADHEDFFWEAAGRVYNGAAATRHMRRGGSKEQPFVKELSEDE